MRLLPSFGAPVKPRFNLLGRLRKRKLFIRLTGMFSFTLREMFFVTALVAMGCGWWVDRAILYKNQMDLLQRHKLLQRDNEDLRAALASPYKVEQEH